MERFNEDHELGTLPYESLDERGDIKSVSSFTSTLDVELTILFCVALAFMDLKPTTRLYIDEMYTRFGPTPRVCFGLLTNESAFDAQ